MVRVLIADDHAVLRDGLRGAFTDAGLEVVGEAVDGEEAVELARRTRPDVFVMDLSMPVIDGIEATRRVHRVEPDVRVLVLTMHADPELVGRARAAGAIGYLLKDSTLDEVVEAVRRVADGKSVISPGIIPTGPVAVADRPEPAGEPVLSPREEEVLQALADGASPLEVAKRLFISPKTVKNHLSSIYDKLGVPDRTQAVLTGLRLGLVTLTLPDGARSAPGHASPRNLTVRATQLVAAE
jgi:DNA-binding NarL/FixJ family response regulator